MEYGGREGGHSRFLNDNNSTSRLLTVKSLFFLPLNYPLEYQPPYSWISYVPSSPTFEVVYEL